MGDLIDIIEEYILISDIKGSILKCNSELLYRLEYNEEEVKKLNIKNLINYNSINIEGYINSNKNKCNYEESYDINNLKIYPKNSNPFTVSGKFILKKYKEKEYIIIILKDEQSISDKNINSMKNQIKILEENLAIESMKNEFFANLSHEFKTPLNIILGTMQLINKNIEKNNIFYDENFNLKKYNHVIKQNSYRLLKLVNNLVDITRIDAGYYNIKRTNQNIVEIVEDITMSISQYAEEKGINLIFDTDEEEIIIGCDPDKIERIILNLLSNAIKYTDYGGEIKVSINLKKDKVYISVKDNGVGISEEGIKTVFERFVQDSNGIGRRCEGIGLSLVKSLVEMHGGSISVNSKINEGSEFKFELPNKKVVEDKTNTNIREASHSKIEKCDIEFSDIYSN
ncbi:HAMP domain-containing histidine kinase [Romboutsia sp. CE17]|uniref:sensor histidine kinase n=1 Tax=Romboutsia sp. CE17 TaxID=2724150 RepID=UPI001442B72E|nr:HAMP domain-containing sensor histidine kinase [Romboutsia sp. CE17]QJA08134.1 HAMP domain-containing histidine kinase [Romboutsia sp. CE17]